MQSKSSLQANILLRGWRVLNFGTKGSSSYAVWGLGIKSFWFGTVFFQTTASPVCWAGTWMPGEECLCIDRSQQGEQKKCARKKFVEIFVRVL